MPPGCQQLLVLSALVALAVGGASAEGVAALDFTENLRMLGPDLEGIKGPPPISSPPAGSAAAQVDDDDQHAVSSDDDDNFMDGPPIALAAAGPPTPRAEKTADEEEGRDTASMHVESSDEEAESEDTASMHVVPSAESTVLAASGGPHWAHPDGVRLVNCRGTCCRLEVYHKSEWGTVCDDGYAHIDLCCVPKYRQRCNYGCTRIYGTDIER